MQVQSPNSTPNPNPTVTPQPADSRYDGQRGVSAARVLREWWNMDPGRPGMGWQYLLATAFYNTLIGVVLAVFFSLGDTPMTWWEVLLETWMISQCIGFSIHFGFSCFYRYTTRAWRDRLPRSTLKTLHVIIPITCVYIGYTLAFAIKGRNFLSLLVTYPRIGVMIFLIGLVVSFVWYLVMDGQTRSLRMRFCRFVVNTQLHPQHLGFDVHGFCGNGRNIGAVAEAIHHVDGFNLGHV